VLSLARALLLQVPDAAALVAREGGAPQRAQLDRRWAARIAVEVPAGAMRWWVFRAP